MKKVLIGFVAVLFAVALLPQSGAANVGIKGGFALSNLRFSNAGEVGTLSNLSSMVGGVSLGMNLGLFCIQPEILYVRMGAKQVYDSVSAETHLDYVQVPLFLKINVMPGPVSPMIYGGGYGSYLLSAKGVIAGESQDIKDEVKSTDYGLVFGGGVDFKLAVVKLTAEIRYNLGLANIAKNPDPVTLTVKNKSLMFLVGVTF
ncbi:MAG: porin family protein [Acidobacteriota bacterium]